ncbi:hypothetical protein [Romboutsia lituseburensis]|uniref:Uncharacterized protein n=1 Tax=Romboutsia lituseburensis DSM 797 TaxID=1121325 RepID=A0A1G9P3Q9_9FIRM|nr:hypothetical protein [Romboutsia lituseburensis]CEH33233.1 Hypothetical protein RLITU_0626 [Romboutsia lituseburensis]SDL93468.1 hypothetical protein SAMN04515677_104205 [Romboutsia lituseburensis DSM 797]
MNFININIFIDRIEFYIFNVENNEKRVIMSDTIVIPKSFQIGDKLNYLRKFLIMLVQKYNIKKSNIVIEDAIGIDIIDIVKVEGIVEEVFSNCGVIICK